MHFAHFKHFSRGFNAPRITLKMGKVKVTRMLRSLAQCSKQFVNIQHSGPAKDAVLLVLHPHFTVAFTVSVPTCLHLICKVEPRKTGQIFSLPTADLINFD